jgi:hypothetical protein
VAQPKPAITFEDIPLAAARKMSRGPRMDPFLYQALKGKIQELHSTAARMTLPEGINPVTMKNRILRVAAELNVPVSVRRVPRGLLFWRSTAEDLMQAQELAKRLHPAWNKRGVRRIPRRRA